MGISVKIVSIFIEQLKMTNNRYGYEILLTERVIKQRVRIYERYLLTPHNQ